MADPRIILFDLEILPDLASVLKHWCQLEYTKSGTLKASVTSIICAGWKVFGRDEPVNCVSAWDFPEWERDVNDDRLVCAQIANVLRNADCVITHNGKRFDWKYLQTRLLKHKLDPLPKIHHVDTCVEMKRELFIFNNKLQTASEFFSVRKKLDHEGWGLWCKVHARDKKATEQMTAYCKQDVVALEDVFREIRPIVKGLPNHNLFSPYKEKVCPKCGGTRLHSEGKRYTHTRVYNRYVCKDCRSWFRTDLGDELPRE